jgi:hypothetical protein
MGPGVAVRGRLWNPGTRVATDGEAGVRLRLDRGTLIARLLSSAPHKTRDRVHGEPIRATCGQGFASTPGDPRRQARTRIWPTGRTRLRYRFRPDMSHIATWCRLEQPVDGHVAFVRFR